MSDPNLLLCVGAAKAGTSWLYRVLHDHPDCKIRAVKEAHYWDTFDDVERASFLSSFETQLAGFHEARHAAKENGLGWKVRNMDRQIKDMSGLIAVLDGDRTGDVAYSEWLLEGVEDQHLLVADITPSYAVLDDALMERMAKLTSTSKVLFLIRDPLARLWSHVRMQAKRNKNKKWTFEEKANNILWRVIRKGQEAHIVARGNYQLIIERLRRFIPADRLMVAFTETMFTPAGMAKICEFLGIAPVEFDAKTKVHEGAKAQIRSDLLPKAQAFLRDQYEWVAANVGPLPQTWQDNLVRAQA